MLKERDGCEKGMNNQKENRQIESETEIRIGYSHHSLEKKKERNISSKLVEEAINFPDYTYTLDGYLGQKTTVYKKFINNHLKVIYGGEKNSPLVITLHWVKTPKFPKI